MCNELGTRLDAKLRLRQLAVCAWAALGVAGIAPVGAQTQQQAVPFQPLAASAPSPAPAQPPQSQSIQPGAPAAAVAAVPSAAPAQGVPAAAPPRTASTSRQAKALPIQHPGTGYKPPSTSGKASASSMLNRCPDSMELSAQIGCLQTLVEALEAKGKVKSASEKLLSTDAVRPQIGFPSVLSTFGVDGGKSTAVLSWPGPFGGVLSVTEGDALPDGFSVESIRDGRVTIVSRSGLKQVLLMQGAGSAAQANAAQTISPMPGAGTMLAPGISVGSPTAIPGLGPARPAPGSPG